MKLLTNAGIYLGANLLSAAIPFLLLPFLTRALSPAEYGIVAMLGVSLSIFTIFTGLNLNGAVGVRYFQLGAEAFRDYVCACVLLILLSTAFVALAVWSGGTVLRSVLSLPVGWLVALVLVAGLGALTAVWLSILQVSGRALQFGALQISRTAIDFVLSILFVLFLALGWQGRGLGQAIAAIVVAAAALLLLRRNGYLGPMRDFRAHSRDALLFGVPLIPHALGGLAMNYTDRLVLINLLDEEQTGLYVVGLQIGMVVSLLAESVNKSFAPWLMERLGRSDDESKLKIVRGTYLTAAALLAATLSVIVVAPTLVPLVVGEKFASSAKIVPFIAVGYFFAGCYYLVVNYVFYAGKTALLSKTTVFMGLLYVPLVYLFVSRFGVLGAGYAFVIINAATFLLVWIVSRTVFPMPWFEFRALAGR